MNLLHILETKKIKKKGTGKGIGKGGRRPKFPQYPIKRL